MEKLEILEHLIKKHGNKINPELSSVKYCQNEEKAMVKLTFYTNRTPVSINLDFIIDDIEKDDDGNDCYSMPLFKPEADIVDNARSFLDLDEYSLIMCIDHIFTEEAAIIVSNEFLNKNIV
jgi:hypothetical protein